MRCAWMHVIYQDQDEEESSSEYNGEIPNNKNWKKIFLKNKFYKQKINYKNIKKYFQPNKNK